MPHPIPANPASIEGWRYYLVAIPDDDVAVSAAWAIYSELINGWAWGLEGREANSDIMAQVWADALFETIRIRTMGFPDDVLTHIDGVESLLTQLLGAMSSQGCCPETGPPVVSGIDTEIDDVPTVIQTNYGTGNDWPTVREDYFCPALSALWDGLEDNVFDPLSDLLAIGGLGIAALTSIYASWAGIMGVVLAGIELGTAIGLLKDLLTSGAGLVFGDYATALADSKASVVCNAIEGTTPQDMQSRMHTAIDNSSLNSLAKATAKVYFSEQVFENIFAGEDGNGNDVQATGTCPDCQGETPTAIQEIEFTVFNYVPGASPVNTSMKVQTSTATADTVYSGTSELWRTSDGTPFTESRVSNTSPPSQNFALRWTKDGGAGNPGTINVSIDRVKVADVWHDVFAVDEQDTPIGSEYTIDGNTVYFGAPAGAYVQVYLSCRYYP